MRNKGDKHYGEWFVATDGELSVSSADRIMGVHISHDPKGRPDFVEIQYQSSEDQMFQSVRMDYLNAMFLLSCLKSLQLDEGTPFPDDPRSPSSK